MSATTEAIELVKLLKPKIGEQAAAKLLDYTDRKQTGEIEQLAKSIDRLWIALIGGFSIIVAIMFYLHSDTKQDMKEIRADIKELRELILQKR